MAADYNQPANAEKRVRFFDGQYLLDQDFIDEQKYHIDRQRCHHRTLHIAGIADGLEVKSASPAQAGAVQVTVTAGTAVDQDGRQLVLAQDRTIDLLRSKFKNKIASIYIVYAEAAVDPQTAGGIQSDSRWQERPEVLAEVKGEAITRVYPLLLLGELTLDNEGAITVNNAAVREYSGLRLPGPGASPPTLRSNANGRATLAGGLAVTGNVGIGTTAPGTLLHVKGGTDPTLKIQSDGANEISGRLALHQSDESGADIYYDGTDTVEALRFDVLTGGTASATALCISNKTSTVGNVTTSTVCNVGIGTTAPTAKLEVNGDIKTDRAMINDGGWGAEYAAFSFKDKGTTHNYALLQHNDGTTYLNAASGKKLLFRINNTDKMTINSNGNVGIGTTSPSATLEIVSTLTATANDESLVAMKIAPTFAEGRYTGVKKVGLIVADGNVGIGTTAPTAKLEVNGDIKTDRAFIGKVGHSGWAGFSHKDSGTTGGYALLQNNVGTTLLNAASDKNIHFRINNADKMILDKDGNVGIGTTSPSATLEIVSTLTANANDESLVAMKIAPTFAEGRYTGVKKVGLIVADGNVGIGTTSPKQALDVNGRIHVNNGVIQRGGTAITNTSDLGLYSGGSGSWMRFVTNNGPIRFYSDDGTGSSSNLTIEANGNVGIGTTAAPTAKLEVNGDIKTDRAMINDGGWGTEYAAFSFKDKGTSANYALLQHSAGTTYLNAASGKNIHFRINNADKMTIDSSGDVTLKNGVSINEFSSDTSLSGNSDSAVPTEKAVKAYVDAQVLTAKAHVAPHGHRHRHNFGGAPTTYAL